MNTSIASQKESSELELRKLNGPGVDSGCQDIDQLSEVFKWAETNRTRIEQSLETRLRWRPEIALSFDDFLSHLWEISLTEPMSVDQCDHFLEQYCKLSHLEPSQRRDINRIRSVTSMLSSASDELSDQAFIDEIGWKSQGVFKSCWQESSYEAWICNRVADLKLRPVFTKLSQLERTAFEARLLYQNCKTDFSSFSEFLTGSQNGVFVPSIVSAAGRALGKLRAYAATTVDSSGQHRNEEILKAVLLSSKEREIWELNCTGIDKREIALRYEMTNDQVRNVINRARMLIARAQGPLSQDEQIVVQAFGEGDNDARLVSKRCELSKNRLATAKRIINARVAVRLGRIPEEETIESPHIIDQIKGSRLRGVAALHFLKLRQVEIANRFDCDVKDIYSRVNALRVRFGIVSAQSERLRELRHKWNTDYQHPPEQAGAELRSIWSSLRPESRMALGLFLTGLTKREAAAKVGITFNEFDYSYRRALSELPTASVRKEIESVRQRVELASDRWNLIFAEPPATAPTQLAAVWSNLSPSHQMALTYRLLGTKSEDAALETGISPSNYRHMLANALKNLPSDVHEQLKATLKLISVRLKSRLDPESIGKGAIESQG